MPTLYFAVRGDSGGTGTKADPYDAAGYGLDTRLRTLQQAATDDVLAFIGPGTIGTLGQGNGSSTGFLLRSGWKLVGGWGGGPTTLRLDGYGGSGATMLGNPFLDITGVHIRNLTLDCNYDVLKAISPSTPINLQGIWITSPGGASNHLIRDVIITNTAGEASEGFPCIVGADGTWATGDVIERVSLTNFRAGACTAIALYKSAGSVRECSVDGSYQIAYGGWDLQNAIFEGNTCGACDYGVNIDSFTNTGVIIRENAFAPDLYGIVLAGHASAVTFANFVITHNRITMGAGGQYCVLYQGLCTGNLVKCNTFTGGSASTHAWRETGTGNSGNMCQDNSVAAGWTSSAAGACVFHTMHPDGSPHAGLTDTQGTPCTPGRCPELGINAGHVAAMTAL